MSLTDGDHDAMTGEQVDLSENNPLAVAEILDESPGHSHLPHHKLARFMNRLFDAFGWRYTAMACIVYGANGTGETFVGTASEYYFYDILQINSARFTQIQSFASIPWQIKALYGMTSDQLSFCGLRRTPYILLANVLGALAGFALWSLPLNVLAGAGFLTLVQFSVALSDVMIDGSSGEKAHHRPDMATDLQAVMHSASYVVSFTAHIAVGYLVDPHVLGSRGVFGLFVVSSLSMFTPTACGWLGESTEDEAPYDVGRMLGVYTKPKHGSSVEEGGIVEKNPMSNKESDVSDEVGEPGSPKAAEMSDDDEILSRVRKPIFIAAVMNSVLSFILGVTNLLYTRDDKVQVLGSLTVSFAVAMAVILYYSLSPISMDLAKGAIYILLEGAFHPSTSVIFQWSHSDGDKGGNCSGNCASYDDDDCGWARSRDYPCITPSFYGWAKAMANIFALGGVVLYTTYFANWRYKQIFYFGHCVYFAANLMDLVWVTRTNVALGINDEVFLMGSEMILPALSKLHTMPILILSAKLCPKSVEATLFALMMGVWNFGGSLGKYNGVVLTYMFGGIESPEFKGLEPFIFIRCMMYLGPLILTFFLAPNGGPNDSNYYAKKKDGPEDDLDDVDKALKNTSNNKEIELTETNRAQTSNNKKQVYAKVGQLSSIDETDSADQERKDGDEEVSAELV